MGFYLNKSPFFLFNNPQRTTATATMVKLDNPNLDVNNDTWYHLGLNACDEIKENFSDVTYVCIGGKEKRMQVCAEYLYKQLGQPKSCLFEEDGRTLKNLSGHAQRYAMYKVGPVLIANHGMGQPTTFILLHEIAKLLSYAGCEDVKLFPTWHMWWSRSGTRHSNHHRPMLQRLP